MPPAATSAARALAKKLNKKVYEDAPVDPDEAAVVMISQKVCYPNSCKTVRYRNATLANRNWCCQRHIIRPLSRLSPQRPSPYSRTAGAKTKHINKTKTNVIVQSLKPKKLAFEKATAKALKDALAFVEDVD